MKTINTFTKDVTGAIKKDKPRITPQEYIAEHYGEAAVKRELDLQRLQEIEIGYLWNS